MSCSCAYVGDHTDNSYFCSESYPQARREHTCGECRRTISPGEKYERANLGHEGSVITFKTCEDCLSVRESFFCHGWIYQNIWSDLRKHIRNRLGEISSDCITPLTPKAREQVCELIEERWEDLGGRVR